MRFSGPKNRIKVTRDLIGAWDRDKKARLSIYLQQLSPRGDGAGDVGKLIEAVQYDAQAATVDLSG